MSYKGIYFPKNPKKYDGDPTKIRYLSSWEYKFMQYCDSNPSIISWGSETIVIPYICKTDNRQHRYYMDFIIKYYDKNKKLQTTLIEIKPHIQTLPPVCKNRKTKRYLHDVLTYAKNTSKWETTKEYCKKRGWNFQIFTEHHLFPKKTRAVTNKKRLKLNKKPITK